ncbi:hypothetical protein MNBD_NITROSPINAE02-670 [hydrothermal vent metagenome]|uniref:Filament cap protein n=1 Tax=hydrothermal vent metagenome TaxID=652676 RepID=A0A3B1D122_9ZZZZ
MDFSVDGLVSGLDTTSIVSQLIELQRRPITLLENRQIALADQKAAWQEMSTQLLKLETAVNKLNFPSKFSQFISKFNSNNSSGGTVLSVSAGSSTTAGIYSVAVSQLAQAQKSASSETYSSLTTALGASGTITIGGSYNVTVALTDTLEQIKNNINSSGAPVTATVINTASTSNPAYKLLVAGSNTGASNSFTITDATDGSTNITFGTTLSAQDAALTIDGISVTKDSNAITDLIFDATINLETTGSGTITFAADNEAIIDNVKAFTAAYNDVKAEIAKQFALNTDKNTKGALFGNLSLETIQNQIVSILSNGVPGIDGTDSSNLAYLSQIGVATDEENLLQVDEAKLRDMLVNRFDDVQNIFAPSGSGTYTFVSALGATRGATYNTRVIDNGGTTEFQMQDQNGDGSWVTMATNGNFVTGVNDTILEGLILRTGTLTVGDTGTMRVAVGVAERLAYNTAKYTEFSTEGLIFNQNDSIEKQDKELQKQIDDLEERLAKKEVDLKTKFVKLETLLSQLSSQQSYLDSQLANLSRGWK